MSSWEKKDKKWRARININGKLVHLGSFDTKVEADEAERIARENNPSKEGQNSNSHNVTFKKSTNKFYVRFRINGKRHFHGPFETRDEAIQVAKFLKEDGTKERPAGIRSNNTSGHAGVSWNKLNNKWRVRIMVNGKSVNFGSFNTIEEAIAARKEAENA